MARTKGAKDKNPRKPRSPETKPRQPRASSAQERAQSQAMNSNSNGVNGEAAAKVLKAALANHDERLSIMGSAMNACRVTRTRDKDMFARARSDGLPVRALKGWLKQILLERAHRASRDEM